MRGRSFVWIIAALLGIAATVAVAWTATQLAAQSIGLASDPRSVADGLSPQSPGVRLRRVERSRSGPQTTPPAAVGRQTVSPPPAVAPASSGQPAPGTNLGAAASGVSAPAASQGGGSTGPTVSASPRSASQSPSAGTAAVYRSLNAHSHESGSGSRESNHHGDD